MHTTILAKRQLDAQKRCMAAIETLAQKHNITKPETRQVRQPAVKQLFTWEAVADVLEAMTKQQPGITVDDVLAIDGLSKTSIKAIKKHFNVEDSTDEE